MATAPAANLPLFYQDLVPLSSIDHANFRARALDKADFLINQHAVPLTSDEFASASRFYPIVFSAGDNPVPLALMGLNEGVNTFVGEDGKLLNPVYVPAYVRRYPFLLAKLRPDTDELSLCFDPTSGAIGEFDEGDALFENGEPTEPTKAVLEFCKNFEEAGQRTGLFMEELKKADLLMDGEVSIQPEGSDKPFIYRGFQMVDENKLRELRGDVLRKMMQNGMLGLIFAHLFSLQLMREVFAEQIKAGKVPEIAAALNA
ncbi:MULTISPECIES: SapC family protein [unclassified Sphingopyxis]|uniref:SapC family protein n=1 Tax=unclassified Sphingopyxis TaxID=2614943 RepID=UPI0007361985|nr:MULTISPECIES: SapC family protein [unclassified Sphingopyxis]KTE33248.1 multidrug transporter [Sphingopyxis sp. HIX]KTE79901.1 multidrug transporter [Sphingopyxis sp. HXXIV]